MYGLRARWGLDASAFSGPGLQQHRFGASPETLWRILLPAEWRWRNVELVNLTHGPGPTLSDSVWLAYLEKADGLKEDYQKKGAAARAQAPPGQKDEVSQV